MRGYGRLGTSFQRGSALPDWDCEAIVSSLHNHLGLIGLIALQSCVFLFIGLNFKEPAMKKVWEAGFQEKNFAIDAWRIHLRGIPL